MSKKVSEKQIEKLTDKIIDIIEGTVIPKTVPMTKEECEQFLSDPDIKMKVETVSKLLSRQGFEAASKEVSPCNIKQYAQWVLHKARCGIKLTDPVTRKSWIDPKAENLYEDLYELFTNLDLL